MEENTRENKMGTMPIGKLLANMAGPVMISMLFQALYNIVDSVFVARLRDRKSVGEGKRGDLGGRRIIKKKKKKYK